VPAAAMRADPVPGLLAGCRRRHHRQHFSAASRNNVVPMGTSRNARVRGSIYVASSGRSFGASLIGMWISAAPIASMMSMYVHSDGFGKVLERAFVRDDRGARLVHPFVAVGVIPMPMGIDEVLERGRTNTVKGGRKLWLRNRDTGIDHQLAFIAVQNGDVSAGAYQYTDVAAQWLDGDIRLSCLGVDLDDGTVDLGKRLTAGPPHANHNESGGRYQVPVWCCPCQSEIHDVPLETGTYVPAWFCPSP
jgi:hypothetical protein